MTRSRVYLLLTVLWLAASGREATAAETRPAPDFKEVYDIIANQGAVGGAELNRAAVNGLITELAPKVFLVTPGAAKEGSKGDLPPVSRTSVFEESMAYLRIAEVGYGLANAVTEAIAQMNATNKLKGVVIDLRYTDGDDYGAAVDTANLFVEKSGPLLDWGNGPVHASKKTNAIAFPIAVLVNHDTARAAEALAAILRESGSGLILGNRTAGEAMRMKEFPLKNGQQLRVAIGPVRLGAGTELPMEGVKPDIEVMVSPQDERAYYADAFLVLPRSNFSGSLGTNAARRLRLSEADLVRERRQSLNGETDATPPRETKPEAPVVSDPALARALDLLKGLAVVRQSRS